MSKLLTQEFRNNMPNMFGNNIVTLRLYDHEDGKTKEKGGAIEIPQNKIDLRNDMKNKFSIFFHPNGDMGLTESKHIRQNRDAKTIYCFYVDIDQCRNTTTKKRYPELKHRTRDSFQFKPTAVIDTCNGWHLYWILKTPLICTEENLKNFDTVMKWLAVENGLGGDPSVTNIGRIMRLPGTKYHSHKQGIVENPMEVDVVEYDPNIVYEIGDFLEELNFKKKVEDSRNFSIYQAQCKVKQKESAYNQIVNFDVVSVLNDLGQGKWTIKDNGDIYEGKDYLSGYKYCKRENFVNSKLSGHDRPNGNAYSVAKRFLKEDLAVYQYFLKKWSIGEDYKKKPVQMVGGDESGKKRKGEPEPTFGSPDVSTEKDSVEIKQGDLTVRISYTDNKIYAIKDGDVLEIMNASLKVQGYFCNTDEVRIYIVEYCKPSGDKGVIHLHKLGKGGELERRISEVGIDYYGSEKAEKFINTYIHSSINKLDYVNSIGVYAKDTIINKVGSYIIETKKNKMYVDITDFSPIDNKDNEVFTIGDNIGKEEFRNELQSLEKAYAPNIIYSLFCSYALGLFAYDIRNEFKSLAPAGLVGLSMSGKTTTRHLIMNMLGLDRCTEIASDATFFSFVTIAKHFVPISVTEYENGILKGNMDSFMKNCYDGTVTHRGTANQELKHYKFNAAFTVDGETGSMTNSVNTRKIGLQFNPRYKKLEKKKVKNINGYLLENYDNIKNIRNVYERVREELTAYFKPLEKEEKERSISNYSLLIAFAECFGFDDIVKGHIIKQLEIQFAMAGDDMLDKIIKQMFTLAIIYKMSVTLEDKTLKIDFMLDHVKVDKNKYDDICSQIKTVNNHFNFNDIGDSGYMGFERLEIPVEYLFKARHLHSALNILLDYVVRLDNTMSSISDDGPMILALRQYAESNGYTKHRFYEYRIKDDHDYGKYHKESNVEVDAGRL